MTSTHFANAGPVVVSTRPRTPNPCGRPTYYDPQPQSAYRSMTPQCQAGPTIRVGGVPVAPSIRLAIPTPQPGSTKSTKEGPKSKEAAAKVSGSEVPPQRLLPSIALEEAIPTPITRKGFGVRRSTDTPKLQLNGAPSLPNRKPLGGISRNDLAAQRSDFAAHSLEVREANLKQLAAEAKMSAENARHSLLLLAYTSRQWRKQTAAASASTSSSAPTSAVPILDLYRDGLKYVGVLQDIDNVMSLPAVLATNDEKNMYQKVLQNLSELGLFRPYATPKADWESAAPGVPARGQRRVRLAADQ